MAEYAVTRSSTALSTSNDLITIVAAANRRTRVKAITVGGMGTTSAANSIAVSRSTGGTTPGGALVPPLKRVDDPASSTLVYTTWSAQPTVAAGGPLLRLPVNANGGVIRWVAPPGQEIELRNSEQLSFRSETGTSNVVITVEFDD
jgi:hypothetical protein